MMTTTRQVRANRDNAQHSTGPRTATGKARSSLNNLRHGLAVAVSADPAFASDIADLALAIAGDAAGDPVVLARARSVAEAELTLVRVRLVRTQLADHSSAKGKIFANKFYKMLRRKSFWNRIGRVDETGEEIGDVIAETFYGMYGFPETPAEQQEDTLKHMASDLAKFDRYERRALSRRRKAIRAFDQALAERARHQSAALGP